MEERKEEKKKEEVPVLKVEVGEVVDHKDGLA
jgi:hypothetical protein